MLTLFMRYIALAICTLWLSCGLTLRALAQATSDFKVLPLKTEGVRESGAASVAGDVQSWVRGNGSSRGQFSYRLPINLDDSRAPFFVDVVPVWQQGQGLGVWGQGWEMGTSIKRVNMSQEINFKTDFLQSPWGLLAQGQDGYWYSKDLRQRIRAFVSSEEISAWLPDGTHLEFQTEDSKLKDLVWRLVKATNQRGYVMQFDYEEKGADQSYLSRISWGLDDLAIVNRLSFTYEELPAEQKWTSFLYGGQTRTLDKRIKALHFVNVSGVQEQLRWSYELTYRLSQSSPAFYLSSIQQVFPGGVRRPSLGLEWGDFDADAKKIDITSSQKLKPIIDRIGFARFNQQYLSQHDFNLDGLEDVEIGADNSFFLQTLGGIAANQLREAANGTKLECRKQSNPSNSSRQIVKLGGFKAESLVTFLKTTTSTQTILYLCDLEGRLKQEIRVDGAFGPDPRTRFADLNHDGKPDLIRVLAGSYQISKNLSQDGSYEFGPTSSYPLAKEFDASRGVYIEDINGDGFVDLVSFRASQLVYAPGKGRMQFGPELVRTSILNKDNKTLNFTGFELYFVDANRDGLSDLFGIKSNRFSLFMNVGSRYQEVDLSYLQPKISYTKFLYSDLLGTGLPGLLQAQSDGSVKVLHLTQPQHGLLQKISDGLGNTMDLKWDMAPPMFKAGERPVVLKEALVRSYGDSDQVLVYDYKSPKVSSDGLRFLGFQEMTQNQKHKATKIHYDYSDEVDGIILSEIIRDSRRPDLTFSSLYEYEDQIFSGLHWKALKSKVSGFVQNENGGNISKTETWSDYNDKLCPQKISVTAGEQSEVKSISYWQTPGIWKGMTCFESNVKVQPSIESSIKLEWDIKRDGIGLIKSIEQKTENEDLLLQALEYDADNRIERESYADGRFLNLSYLGKTLVVQKQVDEAGRNVSLPGLSEIDSLPRTRRLTNEDKNFDLALTWDSEERLETLFYEDFMDIPSKYHVRYDYNLSGNDRLGVLQENRLYSDGSQTTIGKAFSANGLPLAQIARVDNSYSVRGLLKSHTTDQRTETYAMRKDPLNLELLRMEALMGDSMKLGSSENDSFSFLLESWKTFEDGVSGNNAQVVTLEDGFLKVSEFRQSELSQVKWYDSAMRMKRMQLGQKLDYRFNYDWHGRFQSIAMPDGSFLSIAYDEFGRKKSVQHSKLGSREFLYKKQTGLLDQILVKGAQGKKQRSTAFKYDEKARVIGRIHQVDGKSKAFSLSYDGNMGFGARKNHQLGFQTGERSDDYAKNVIHSVDGKVIRQEQAYGDSMLLSQSFEQDWDGFVKSRNIELKDLNGPSLFSYRLSQSRDSLGRLKYVYLDQKLLLTFEYDDLGRVDKVIDSSGRVTSLRYDQLTKGMKGWDSVVGQQKIDYEWHYDERGLIASESFVTYEQAVAKAYSYDEAEFLINEVSQLDTRAYAYDYDLRQERRDLALDDFGYRTSAKGLSLSYGADGHLESSVGPAGLFRYVHDADGQRIARFKNGKLDMIFADDLVIREGKIFQRLKVQGILLGIIEQGQFRPVYTDSRGTPFFAGQEGLKVSGAYGETMLEADQDVLNYAGFGKDKELGWVRFGVRDYDPASGLFTSPDSLFLENPELCVESPVECNLYSYAKNNPLKYTDPAGQAAFLAIVPIIGYVASEFFDTDTAHAPGRNDQPQSTTTGFNQDQQRVLDRGVDFLGKAIDKVVPGPNVIGPTMKMAREAHQQSGNQTGSKLKPNLEATGPHTTFSRDQNGNVYKYETYDIQPKGHWEPLKRFDGGKPDGNPGATHRNSLTGESIPTPHTQSKYIEGGVEYATPREIPDNARFNNGR